MDKFKRLDKEELDDYFYRIANIKWGLCRWGGSQYASMQAIYDSLNKMKKSGLTKEQIWDIIGIKIELSYQNNIERSIKSIKNYFIREYIDIYGDQISDDEQKNFDKLIAKKFKTLDEILNYCLDGSWDLWKTIPFIFYVIYPEHKVLIKKVKDSRSNPDQLFRGNKEELGIKAWILSLHFGVKDKSFFYFDTYPLSDINIQAKKQTL